MFDLQHALDTWRTGALHGGTLSAEDADELVMYLEDETERLIGQGMEPADAFRIAQVNLGDLAILEAEYRTNTSTRERAFRFLRVTTMWLLIAGGLAAGAQVLTGTEDMFHGLWEFTFGFSHLFIAIIAGWGVTQGWLNRSLKEAMFYALPLILYATMGSNGATDLGVTALHFAQALILHTTLRPRFDTLSPHSPRPQTS